MSRPPPPRGSARTLSPAMWATLVDEELIGDDERAEPFFWEANAVEVAWKAWQPDVIDQWIRQHPGTRPSNWWNFSAPEPHRLRLGGIGVPIWEVRVLRAYMPQFHLGVPAAWLSDEDVRFYAEVMKRPIVDGEPIDPNFPPIFESQAAYLRRLGLLTAGEARRLSPANFLPEPVTKILMGEPV